MQETYRQGDLLLRRIAELPKNLKEKDAILLRGETTGHAHRMQNAQVMVAESGQQFVVAGENSQLIHEEHDAIDIPKGVYEVSRQREYDPVAERQVSD